MGIRIIDPEMVERCAFALFAVDYASAPEMAWAGLTATARHAYAVRALTVLEEALRSPLVDESEQVTP